MLGSRGLSRDNFVDGGTVAAAVLAVVLVALSTYGRRFRHPVFRLVAWGASIVFLPITSSIIFNLLERNKDTRNCGGLSRPTNPAASNCKPDVRNMWTVLLWIVIVLAIKCNADMASISVSTAAASPAGGDVSIDGQRIKPTIEHLANYAWVTYLIYRCFPLAGWVGNFRKAVFVAFSVLGPCKAALKLAAFWGAGDTFAVTKNARLITGYMEQLVVDGQADEVPRYIVMGEKEEHVEESPHGYRIKRKVLENKSSGLVTLDHVWQLAERRNGILEKRQELRDLCLSYSLFKLLRRRLSGYPLADAGSSESLEFVLRGMDSVGTAGSVGINQVRVFNVLVDELWFASDFYYSPIPLCTFGGWCAALNYLCSILLIVASTCVGWIYFYKTLIPTMAYKVITFSLLLVLVLVETWEVIAGVCSNWTKMALLGHYIRHQSVWDRCSCIHTVLGAVLRLRPASRWSDRIGQNSMLEPRRFRSRTGFLSEQLYGRSGLHESIEVNPATKGAVLMSLLSSYGRMSKDTAVARRVGGNIDWSLYGSDKGWAWNGNAKSTTELILMWHIGTRLFQMKVTPTSDMHVASHLSNYCTYLVAAVPELLPDCAAWTKKRYEEVAKDVKAALIRADVGDTLTADKFDKLVNALSHDSHDSVLQRGAEIGQHLVEQYAKDNESGCRILADFWSEVLLYVAPTENVKGHVEAMARGGEFITLIWALLLHAGVTTRPERPEIPGPGGATV